MDDGLIFCTDVYICQLQYVSFISSPLSCQVMFKSRQLICFAEQLETQTLHLIWPRYFFLNNLC